MVNNPLLDDVRYRMPGSILVVGLLLIAFGGVLAVAGWLASPRWTRPVEPAERLNRWLVYSSLAIATVGPLLMLLLIGHRSPFVPNLIGPLALGAVVGVWQWWRAISDR